MKDQAAPRKRNKPRHVETPASVRRGSIPHPILQLQSAAGNFAVQRLIQRKYAESATGEHSQKRAQLHAGFG